MQRDRFPNVKVTVRAHTMKTLPFLLYGFKTADPLAGKHSLTVHRLSPAKMLNCCIQGQGLSGSSKFL